ncbi:MAG: hypothetical protein QM703_19250 [Gemmatales bacterium]
MAKRRSRSDETLISVLAMGATAEVAAQKAEVSTRTVYRRLQDEEFLRRLEEYKVDILRRTASSFVASNAEAMRTILHLLKENNPASVRLGASRAILDYGLKLREITDIADRLDRVEQRAGVTKPKAMN